jgi:putative tryptophan/tyrosine transport system substrate-binding protein
MNRRAFVAGLGSLTAAPLRARAQEYKAGKAYRIGYLAGGSSTSSRYTIEAFRQGLRELGWVEGQNIVIDYRFAEGRLDPLPDLAAELVRLKVDVIVASPFSPAAAAKNATGTIPIVRIGAGADPVGQGLIASLARPGGNVTGLSYGVGQEIFGKQLALLKEVVPKVRRVAVLWNPAVPPLAPAIEEVKVAARSFGLQLQFLEARGPNEFDAAFAAMAKERVSALLVLVDPMFSLHGARLAELTAKGRLPAAYTNRLPVEAGGLMSYGPSFSDLWRRAAVYADKILKGGKPADLPVEQPTKFELVINMKTAKGLGLTIPPSLLLRADQVIE